VGVYADLLRHRELFGSLFRRDLRAKYKGSVLGLAWTLALPAALLLVYLVVFAVLWKAEPTETDDYWLFLLCGLPPWVFFATSLQAGARSLVENAPIIRKVRFPRQLVPLSVVATELVAFAAMTAIVLVLALWFRPESRDLAWLVDLLHWGNPVTPAVEAYRAPLYAGELPSAGDAVYVCVAAGVALVLGAVVFNAVDDRIASEA